MMLLKDSQVMYATTTHFMAYSAGAQPCPQSNASVLDRITVCLYVSINCTSISNKIFTKYAVMLLATVPAHLAFSRHTETSTFCFWNVDFFSDTRGRRAQME